MSKRMLPGSELLSLLLLAICIHCTSEDRIDAGRTMAQNYPCSKTGFFSAPDSCQDYYECRLFRGSLYPVPARCPPGRIFDDVYSECTPKEFITSPPRCVQDTAVIKEPIVDIVVGDPSDVGVVDDPSAVGVVDGSSAVGVVDSSAVGVVDDSSAVGVVDDSGVVADDIPVLIHVDEMTGEVDQDSLVPTEGNVTGNETDALKDFDVVGQDLNGTSNPLVNETVIANGTEEIVEVLNLTMCDHMNMVDSYATLVISSPSLRESFGHQDQYNKNLEKFNRDLEEARNNTILWRHGDSVSIGIKKTIQMASEYKPGFDRKLKINQARVQNIYKTEVDPKLIDGLAADIKNLQEDIKGAEQALQYTDVPDVRQYFENLVESKRRTIERKQQEMKSTSKVARVLKELLHFLEYVRDDAKEVEDLAKHWQERMDSLHGNMINDTRAFKKYVNRADEGILLLTEEEEMKREDLRANVAEQKRLEDREEKLDVKLDALNDANYNITQEIFMLTELMGNKTDNFNDKREALCKPDGPLIRQYLNETSSPYEKAVACNRLLRDRNVTLDLSKERVQVRQLRKQSKKNTNKVNKILGDLDSITETLKQLYDAVPHLEIRLQQINLELGILRMHTADLRNLQDGADTSIRSLLAIREEFLMLGDTFESLTSKFENMMARGNAAEGDVNQRREIMAIDASITDIQQQVDQFKVPDIETCT